MPTHDRSHNVDRFRNRDKISDLRAGDGGVRVLIIDDSVDLATTMALLLEHSGFDVQIAFSGKTGLATARSFRPQFVLLDIGMLVMDGFQVAEQLRKDPELNHVVVIAISAYNRDTYTTESTSSLVRPLFHQAGRSRQIASHSQQRRSSRIFSRIVGPNNMLNISILRPAICWI